MNIFELIAFTLLIAAKVGIASLVANYIHPALYYPTVAALVLGFILMIARVGRDSEKAPRASTVSLIIALFAIALATAFAVQQARVHSVPALMAYFATPAAGLTVIVIVATILRTLSGRGKKRD
jgi:hypothetical protein